MRKSQEDQNNDAALLANNMAGLTTQLNEAYRQFITRAINEDGLRSKILAILNGNYRETLVEPIIKELELRLHLRDRISRIIEDKDCEVLTSDQLALDANHQISVPQTIKQYYIKELTTKKNAHNG